MFEYRVDEDLELRLVAQPHAAPLFEVIDRHRADLRTWLPWVDGSRSAEDIARFISSARQAFVDGKGVTCGIWHGGRVAGVIGLTVDQANRSGEVGYWLDPRARGRGLMTRAVRAVVGHGFDGFGLNRIVILCATDNQASRAVPERLGFTLEGVLREAEWVNDHFNDLAVYAALRRDRS